jgi:hypothetical protein
MRAVGLNSRSVCACPSEAGAGGAATFALASVETRERAPPAPSLDVGRVWDGCSVIAPIVLYGARARARRVAGHNRSSGESGQR